MYTSMNMCTPILVMCVYCILGHQTTEILLISFFSLKEGEKIREASDKDLSFILLVFRKRKEICESKASLGISRGKCSLL